MEKNLDRLYENFVKSRSAGTIFQSRLFGEFQESIAYRGDTWTIIKIDGKNGDVIGSCLVVRMKMRFGLCWLWVPYGPLCSGETCSDIFDDLARIAHEENAVFARIEPAVAATPDEKFNIKPARKRFTPEHSLIIDLEKSEKEILAHMKPKGRYNIGVARKNGVAVRVCGVEKTGEFYSLLKKTSARDSFGIHPLYFYENLLKMFGGPSRGGGGAEGDAEGAAKLFLAYKDGVAAAGAIVMYYKNTATYYFGASDPVHRAVMAPYLLHWEIMLDAKKRGYKNYDFLGIAPPDAQNHEWSGITEFKKKFGGRTVSYPSAFDIVYRPILYRLIALKD